MKSASELPLTISYPSRSRSVGTHVSARTAIPARTARNTTPPHKNPARGACAGAESVCVAYRYPAVAVPMATVVEHSVKRSLTSVSARKALVALVAGRRERLTVHQVRLVSLAREPDRALGGGPECVARDADVD